MDTRNIVETAIDMSKDSHWGNGSGVCPKCGYCPCCGRSKDYEDNVYRPPSTGDPLPILTYTSSAYEGRKLWRGE